MDGLAPRSHGFMRQPFRWNGVYSRQIDDG